MHREVVASDMATQSPNTSLTRALCVDYDGTYIRTDAFFEGLTRLLFRRPQRLLHLPVQLGKGRAYAKQWVWENSRDLMRVELFPVAPEVAAMIGEARDQGRVVDLVSASPKSLLDSEPTITERFDAVLGSEGGSNLKAEAKADRLHLRHPDGFDYIGNSRADIPVWRKAQGRYGIGVSRAVRLEADRNGLNLQYLAGKRNSFTSLLAAMRLHQWLKNILIFVPLMLNIHSIDMETALLYLVAFLAMGLLASGTYIVNDMADLDADRAHPRKRLRPLAAGDLPLAIGWIASPALMALGIAIGFWVSPLCGATLVAYLFITLAYSFDLKKRPLLDVMVIAVLFTLRIVAGMVIVSTELSYWLLNFSAFLFTSLALMKRDAELLNMRAREQSWAHGRGYGAADRDFVFAAGVATATASQVIFALFVSSLLENGRQYSMPFLLWISQFFLGYWLMRLWFKTHRGEMHEDPIVYTFRDRIGLLALAAVGFLTLLAQIV